MCKKEKREKLLLYNLFRKGVHFKIIIQLRGVERGYNFRMKLFYENGFNGYTCLQTTALPRRDVVNDNQSTKDETILYFGTEAYLLLAGTIQ